MKAFVLLLCWLASGLPCRDAHAARGGVFDDRRLSNLPAPVRQTVVSVLGSGRLTDLLLTNENGHAVYEVEVRQRGVDRSFTVAADGSLVARQVFMNELPPAVRETVQREITTGKVQELYWLNEDGAPVYYVEFQKGRQLSSLTVAPDGWVTSRQASLKETPAPVQAAIRDKLEGRTPTHIARAVDGDEVTFEVTDLVQGRERLWIFDPDGSVAAEALSLSAVPGAARTTLTRQSAGARIVHVFKIPNDGSLLYEVCFVRQDARHVCTVDADGRIVSQEPPLKELPETLQKAIHARAEGRFIVRIETLPGEKGATCDVTLRHRGKTEVLTFSLDGSLIQDKPERP